jgi:hypothetical protein
MWNSIVMENLTIQGTHSVTHDDYIKSVRYYQVQAIVMGYNGEGFCISSNQDYSKIIYHEETQVELKIQGLIEAAEKTLIERLYQLSKPKSPTYQDKLKELGYK